MKKFVLLASASFICISLSAQATPPGSGEEETKPPNTTKRELTPQEVSEKDQDTKKKLFEDFSALLVSFKGTLKTLHAKVFNTHKEKEKEKSPPKKKGKEKQDLNFELSGPVSSNIQRTQGEDILARFDKEYLLLEIPIQVIEDELEKEPLKAKEFGKTVEQLGLFYAEIRAVYGKITRSEVREIENSPIPRGPNGEVISDDLFNETPPTVTLTSSQNTAPKLPLSMDPLLKELKTFQELRRKQDALQQLIQKSLTKESSFSKTLSNAPSQGSSSESSEEMQLTRPRANSTPVPIPNYFGPRKKERGVSFSPPSQNHLNALRKRLKSRTSSSSLETIEETKFEKTVGAPPKEKKKGGVRNSAKKLWRGLKRSFSVRKK